MCGVKIKGTLNNVSFDSCYIKAMLGTSRNTSASVFRENTSNALINALKFNNCILEGGYYNISMINAGASTSNYGNMQVLGCHLKDAYNSGLTSQTSAYIIYTIKNNYFTNYAGSTSYIGLKFGNSASNANIDTCSGNKSISMLQTVIPV